MVEVGGPRWAVIPEVSLAWEARFRRLLDGSFARYVRVLHGPPTRERTGGKLPLVAVHLFDINLTDHAQIGKRTRSKGALRSLRLDYLFSAWAEEPLDEQRLLERIRLDIDADRNLLVSPAGLKPVTFPVTPRPSIKFEHAVSFWNTMGWPVKAALHYTVNVTSGPPARPRR